jgi:hypothetical protein
MKVSATHNFFGRERLVKSAMLRLRLLPEDP